MTSFQSDLVDYAEADIPVKDVTKGNRVMGIGTTTNKVIDKNGVTCYLTCAYYYLQQKYVWLFYPQNYHQMNIGN